MKSVSLKNTNEKKSGSSELGALILATVGLIIIGVTIYLYILREDSGTTLEFNLFLQVLGFIFLFISYLYSKYEHRKG